MRTGVSCCKYFLKFMGRFGKEVLALEEFFEKFVWNKNIAK
jgi:hypothetical protein